jgi:protein subunit release factor B
MELTMPKNTEKRELLFSVTSRDLEMQSFTVGGAGGQGRDHVNTGVRFIHHASGARGESREFREQGRNKRAALVKLTKSPLFVFWVKTRINEIDRKKTAEQWVDEQLKDLSQIKVEVKDSEGRWVLWDDDNAS